MSSRSLWPLAVGVSVRVLRAALVAVVVALAGLAAAAGSAHAAPTDPVNVPDPGFKESMNKVIATATGTTRTPDQTITEAEAESLTTYSDTTQTATPIADFTGAEALKNVTRFTVTRTAGTAPSLEPFAGLGLLTQLSITGSAVSDLGPVSGLPELATLLVSRARLMNLRGIEGLSNLRSINASYNQLTAVPELAGMTGLTGVNVAFNKIRDLSPLAGLTNLTGVSASSNRLTDIDFAANLRALTTLVASDNLITDVSAFDQIGTYPVTGHRLRGPNNAINLSRNRIRDLSALGAYPGSRSGDDVASKILTNQAVYVGPYQSDGITLDPKLFAIRSVGSGPESGPAATITTAGTGTYDSATGLLTLTDPSARSIALTGWRASWTVWFSEDPLKLSDLRINEVESDGDTVNGDWFELYNPYDTALDVSGLVVSDSDNANLLALPAGSMVPGNGYAAFRTDDPAVTGSFDLGDADSLRIFAPGTTTPASATGIDSHSWTSHATTTYGRTVPGAGAWATTERATRAAENVFPTATSIPTVAVSGNASNTDGRPPLTATVRRPNGGVVATDATGTVVFSVGGQALSGPVTVSDGVAQWTPSAPLSGSPTGTEHRITARYVSAGAGDPYQDSAGESDPFIVTVTILEFGEASVGVSNEAPLMCQRVEATVSGWGAVEPDAVSYLWQRLSDGDWVSTVYTGLLFHPQYGSYSPQTGSMTGDFGTYRLRVTGTKAGYAPKTVLSPNVLVDNRTRISATPAATLDKAAPRVGETVTATHAAWSTCLPSNFNRMQYDYQWLRDGEPIADATDTVIGDPKQVSYVVTAADAGHALSLKVTSPESGFTREASVASAATARVAEAAFASAPLPTIDNRSPKVGQTLAASAGAWSPDAEFSYQWLRDGQPIMGATGARYTTVVADYDTAISVEVTGRATGYVTESKASAATAKVAATVFAAAPDPSIDNNLPKVGDTLTASAGTWSPSAEFSYQWLRGGRPVTGATGATYAVTAADLGYEISVQVTGRATGYTAATKTSAATGRVVARPAENPPVVNPPVVNPPVVNPPVVNPPVVNPPVINPPVVDPPAGETSVRPSIRLVALRGGRVRITVSARGVAKALFAQKIAVKIAGIRRALTVTLKQGTATFRLPARVRAARNVKVTVSLKKFTKKSGTSTYLVGAASKTTTIGVR